MRVLWMTYGAPYPPDSGARMRDFHLIREVARTAEVDLLSLAPPGGPTDLGALSAFCRRVEVFPIPSQSPIENLSRLAGGLCSDVPAAALPNYFPAAAAKVRAMLLANRIELFQVEHSLLAAYGRIGIPTGCRTVLSFHNVGFQQYSGMAAMEPAFMARSLFRLKSAAMRRAETHYAAQYDRCVLVSALEKELLIGAAPGVRADVVENGVDCREKQPLPDDGGEPVLLFLGVMDYPPNADAAVYFVRSILPRIRARVPDVKFCIAGHSPPARVKALAREPGVEVAGFVNDVTPYYRRAAAVVVPLRAGGGTRLKILEAMAVGRAVVSTSIGCEGLAVESGAHLLIADEPQEFADSVVALLSDAARRRALAANARRLVEQRYDWTILGQRLVAIHREIVHGAAA